MLADFVLFILALNTFRDAEMPRKKTARKSRQALVQVEVVERKILLVRDQKVMLDRDLAAIYGVSTKRLNEQVKRTGSASRLISCFNSRLRRRKRFVQGLNLRP